VTADTLEVAEPAPIWARNDAFARAPEGWGWVDTKGRRTACGSVGELIAAIREDRNADVVLAWTPDFPNMVMPEEVPDAEAAVRIARKRRAADDLSEALDRVRRFSLLMGGLILYMFWQGWGHAPRTATNPERLMAAVQTVIHSISVGTGLLMLLVFAFIPWYQARKQLRLIEHGGSGDLKSLIPVLRFETWLEMQQAPVTRLLLVLVGLVGLAQCLPGDSLAAAGLVKKHYLIDGEWWRLFTAPFLHGNILHFLLNGAALLYLGKRVEVFARWPHLPLVFLFSFCIGGEASARFLAATSVGASGGLMGLLGFLLVFESLHSQLVPRAATRRLLGGVAATALIGLAGYKFIDNAAHIGGLLAGMLYAAIVFPKSSSANRPGTTPTDRLAGAAALAAIAASACCAIVRVVF
jgi:membrane associated rhomboid family serine protease